MCWRIASVAAPRTRATAPAGGGFTGSPRAAVAQLGHFRPSCTCRTAPATRRTARSCRLRGAAAGRG
eukprot:1273812-Pleurochrysis_carterae.AAC.1